MRTRRLILERARSAVGKARLRNFVAPAKDDCVGFVSWAYAAAGTELIAGSTMRAGVEAIFARAEARGAVRTGVPVPGDLAFFRETYDRNRNRSNDDGLTHIAIVDAVSPNGTVVLIHRANSGVKRSLMTLQRPTDRLDAHGRPLNDYLRARTRTHPARLTAELFVAFGDAGRLVLHSQETSTTARR